MIITVELIKLSTTYQRTKKLSYEQGCGNHYRFMSAIITGGNYFFHTRIKFCMGHILLFKTVRDIKILVTPLTFVKFSGMLKILKSNSIQMEYKL